MVNKFINQKTNRVYNLNTKFILADKSDSNISKCKLKDIVLKLSDKVFAAFDDRKGPVAVYTTIENVELASKIAVKSIVSTLSARQSNEKVEGEAIIPFPEEGLLSFIYYVSLDQKTETGDFRTISLSYLVPTEQSASLYSNAELLSVNAKKIGQAINKEYVYGNPVSQYLQSLINQWDEEIKLIKPEPSATQTVVEAKAERKVNLYDLFSLFPPETGFRKYIDPITHLILSLLNQIPVILSGPDHKLLLDFTNIIQDFFPLRKLFIFSQADIEGQLQSVGEANIPKADLIVITDAVLKKCEFNNVPVLILTTYQDLDLKNHKFEDRDIKIIDEWLKLSRQSTDIKILKESLEFTKEKLHQLRYLARNYGDSTIKEVGQKLKLEKEALEFCAFILICTGEVTAKEVNLLFAGEYELKALPKMAFIGRVE